jgi:hypothetical protein
MPAASCQPSVLDIDCDGSIAPESLVRVAFAFAEIHQANR